jgi:2-isopropylmalate synthase
VTDGRDALGEATVRISDAEGEYAGRGVSRDIIKASIRAYVNAINRIGIYRHRDM